MTQPNKFRAQCNTCFCTVKPGEGHLERSAGAPGWLVMHNTRAECAAATLAQPGGSSGRDWDGDPGYSDLGIGDFQ